MDRATGIVELALQRVSGGNGAATMTPLRVLQVNGLFTGGGIDNQTIELCAGLGELGDDVTLAIPAGSALEPRARHLGAQIETLPAKSWLKLAMIRRLARLIRSRRAQIIHVHQGRDYWPGIFAARLAGRGTRVGVTRHLMPRPRLLSRWLLLSMSDVIAVSGAALAVLQRELRGPAARLRQISGGIAVNAFQPARAPPPKNFRPHQTCPPNPPPVPR